jgi:ATP-dependent helicase HrpA
MAAARLGDVRRFPFVDPPDPRAITDGVKLLEELNAVKDDRLTETGRQMARLPVDPRIARMIIESGQQGCAREILVIAAALSIQDPRERPTDNQQAADTAHRRFAQPESDFLAFVALWDYLAEKQRELSGSAFRRLCRSEFLNYLRVREWQDLHGQLASLTRDLGINTKTSSSERVRVHTALLAGLLSQVGMKVVLAPARALPGQRPGAPERGRRPLPEYLGARGTRFAVFPGSGLARKPPDWIVAAELVETSRLWARTVAAIEPEWVEPVAAHLVKRSYSEPRWSRAQGSAVATEKVTLYGIPIVADRTVLLHRIDRVLARELFIRHALVEGDWQTRHHFFRDNAKLIEEAASLEQRARRRGLVAGEDALFAFYDARVPADAVTARHFDSWWKTARHETPDLLTLSLDELLSPAADELDVGAYPEVWTSASPGLTGAGGPAAGLALTYAFDPGSESDGVTIDIPLKTLNQARAQEFSWQVPGLRAELVTELVRSLPKNLRRELVPAPNVAREVLADLAARAGSGSGPDADGDVRDILSRELLRLRGVRVTPDDFDLDKLPPHLRITFRVTDGAKVVASGKDLAALQRQLRPKVRATLSARATQLTRTGVTSWDFGPLPRVFTDGEVKAYPALVDAGAAVDVRLFETADAAARSMRAGTRRLVLLNVKSPANEVAKRLTTAQKLVLSDNPHGSVPALFTDCVSAAADGLITEAGGPAWDAEAFNRIVEHVRPRLHAATYEVVTWAEEILRDAHDARMRLTALRSPVLEPAVVDIQAQLDHLIAPGFLTTAGTTRLPALARYVKAVSRRLDKLTDNAGRDAQQMAVVHRVQDAYQTALATLPAEARTADAAAQVRWQIEELRVSLFAQTMGTPTPVSERRIMTAIEHLP